MPTRKMGAATERTGTFEQQGTRAQKLRAALIEGEQSGASTSFNFDEFIAGKRQQRSWERLD